MELLRTWALRWVSESMEKDGSLFLSHPDIVPKVAACDCVAMQLPPDANRLTLAAHSTGALAKGRLACVFFTELSPAQAADLARQSFGDDFSVVTAPDDGSDWRLLPEVPLSPTAPPLILASLPLSRAADAVQILQDVGHTVLYVGAVEGEVKAVAAASIPAAFGLGGCEAVQSAADAVLLSDFLGSLSFAKVRCSLAVDSPEKYVLFSLCPRCSPLV
mmetsp:Transcript_21611/g.40690  ORF Transcript_21611/g.40690 Transcript_21611/m.40690 type:complete len:218 (-) Transcript_21611:43-696(-)